MTREQAKREIVSLDFYLLNHTDDYGEESHTAMMMAINALEELPKRRKEAKRWKTKAMQNNSCEDAISRQAVLESIKNLYPDMPVMDIMGARRKWLEKYAPYFECENAVEHLPSVTPKQRTGHWILRDDINGQYQCDKCGMFSGLSKFDVEEEGWKLSNFCSNCGAKMVEPQESEEQA